MREIKFRAWNEKHSIMVEVGLIDFLNETVQLGSFEYQLNKFPVMQYIGLKDNNGKEIYEGDIVRFVDADYIGGESGEWEEIVCTGQIKWDDELACYYVTGRQNMENEDFFEQIEETEVIGNIYEHPHLIGGA